ncbi:MAG TPA: site-2 protease family protein [bacterium]|nr:site-2 protease family protein [bacterium]
MLTGLATQPLTLVLMLGAVVVAATCHEFAHAYVADRLGDPTARLLGRLSLNPLKHLDLLGTLFFVLFGFGWAKPVPVNPANFQNPRQGMLQVAIAGPLANVTVAFLLGVLGRMVVPAGSSLLLETLALVAWINVILAVFNLIPIPPLDGSRILEAVLPSQHAYAYARFQPYGVAVLLLLLYTGVVGRVMLPAARWLYAVSTGGLTGP